MENPSTSLMNVTIIHETLSTMDCINMPLKDNKRRVRKVLNVFPTNQDLIMHLKDFQPSKFDRSLPHIINKEKITKPFITKYTVAQGQGQEGGDGEMFYYQLRRNIAGFKTSDELTDQWWYKIFFTIPPCASGRLTQTTGTCWFNSVFNTLLLVPEIAEILKAKWMLMEKSEQQEILYDAPNSNGKRNERTLDGCPMMSTPLKRMLWLVIYNILVKGQKADLTHGNFIGELGARVTSIGDMGTEQHFLNAKEAKTEEGIITMRYLKTLEKNYEDGYDPKTGMGVVLNELLSEGTDFRMINCYELYERGRLLTEKMRINEKYLEGQNLYNELKKQYDVVRDKVRLLDDDPSKRVEQNQKIDEMNEINNKIKVVVAEVNKWTDEINKVSEGIEKLLQKKEIKEDNDKDILQYLGQDTPLLLVIGLVHFISKAPETIRINGQVYNLKASAISLGPLDGKGGHAVAGLTCGKYRYIYDSNNYLAPSDWPSGDISEYQSMLKAEGSKHATLPYRGLSYVVYIKDIQKNAVGGMRNTLKKKIR